MDSRPVGGAMTNKTITLPVKRPEAAFALCVLADVLNYDIDLEDPIHEQLGEHIPKAIRELLIALECNTYGSASMEWRDFWEVGDFWDDAIVAMRTVARNIEDFRPTEDEAQ